MDTLVAPNEGLKNCQSNPIIQDLHQTSPTLWARDEKAPMKKNTFFRSWLFFAGVFSPLKEKENISTKPNQPTQIVQETFLLSDLFAVYILLKVKHGS